MKAIRMVVNIYTRGKVTWFFLPWLVLLLQFPVALLVTFIVERFGGGTPPPFPGGLITICLSMGVWGMMNLAETFPRNERFCSSTIYLKNWLQL